MNSRSPGHITNRALYSAFSTSLLEAATKYTLFVTRRCNLACEYCYVGKTDEAMPFDVATRIVDLAFRNTPGSEDIDIGFFGGEPLLEFRSLEAITRYVESHPSYDARRVKLSVVTNGTLLTRAVARFLREHHVGITVSCDGPPAVHDLFRRFPDGHGSSAAVERGIRAALAELERVPVNAVYGPATLASLPEVVDHLSSLGVRQMYLNPDFSARWTERDVERVPAVYRALADRYMRFYREGRPHFISLIDGKITVMLRGGYQPLERCRMGTGEFAFDPSGRVFPCERLVSGRHEEHAIGVMGELVQLGPLRNHHAPGPSLNAECEACGVRAYCVNWCGCSNYFMTGHYNRVGPFLCASERTLLAIAADVVEKLESELGPTFTEHLGGKGVARSVQEGGRSCSHRS
ncbi:radical SAM/SPASM domain-containing protein [Anaeromyxobacter sp. PSR-1]|uniref:radical SAM/SPASM domain-containing protein n=1 Tax=Anaeromyxobacter sp. PSR-1 TaxID=1300915 RepID=UPI0005E6FCFA|nr:radical SAM protein [Anaeromyxobacter sp. PSR-1]GAO02099.1 putative protein [Anaeromyxobacter sp. PSR-1]